MTTPGPNLMEMPHDLLEQDDPTVRKWKGMWAGPDRPLERYLSLEELDELRKKMCQAVDLIPVKRNAKYCVAVVHVGKTNPRPCLIYYGAFDDYAMMEWTRARMSKLMQTRWREVHYRSTQGRWVHAAMWF